MKKYILALASNRIVRNSSILFIGSMICAVGNYLFHLITARMLTVNAYGEMESLIALFYIISVPAGTIMTVIIKYSAQFSAEGRLDKVHKLFTAFSHKLLLAGFICFIVIFFLSPWIAKFLQLSSVLPVIILGTIMITALLLSCGRGVLNGLQKFFSTAINMVIEVLTKIILAFAFIYFAFGVNGAIGAISIAALTAYLFVFKPLRFLLKEKIDETKIDYKEIFLFSLPTLFITLFLNLFYNVDVLLVKHFFDPSMAGQYSALTVLGRIVFFVTMTISTVVFPLTAEAHTKNENHRKILNQGFILVSLIAGTALFLFFSVPGLVIKILIGSKFLAVAPYLGWFGLAMFFYSLVYLLTQYFLSIGKTKCLYIVTVGVAVQVTLIMLFHNSIVQIVQIMNVVMIGTTLALLIYYKKIGKILMVDRQQIQEVITQ
ncbi:MAG: oligosaccharide flippase family protein [Patescibacteria group bacterium]|jgi:O-antigen/teichoic acid export membrane protein